jgi:hypothetical protein
VKVVPQLDERTKICPICGGKSGGQTGTWNAPEKQLNVLSLEFASGRG